ncbi:hypothetical protein [Oceanicola granulosus]|uniref:hypothetical protein n=1 Tax=Oceanicola granulosus TaxID=252302 RepID=UPI0012EA29A6|nr:hypothetical protein [Oceanicola granulosus]
MRAPLLLALAATLLAATSAAATPPRVVNMFDRLFGRTDGSVLILREVTDNHGLHTVRQIDTLLITRDLATGGDTRYRAVDRILDLGPEADPRIAAPVLVDPVNPYRARAADGAWPLDDPRFGEEVTLGPMGLELTTYDGETFELPLENFSAHLERTLAATRAVLPPVEVDGAEAADSFDAAAYDSPLEECSGVTGMRLGPDEPALALVACEDLETGQQVRVWVVVPPLE